MTLSRDQADVLTAYGWQAADILLNPEEGISAARASVFGSYGGGWVRPTWNWDTTAKGIVAWRAPGPRREDVVLTWAELRTAAKALPEPQRTNLSWARRRARRELMRTVPPHFAGGYPPFVEPPPEWRRHADLALQVALAAACDALVPVEDLALFEVPA